jgi:hypothetical protein
MAERNHMFDELRVHSIQAQPGQQTQTKVKLRVEDKVSGKTQHFKLRTLANQKLSYKY